MNKTHQIWEAAKVAAVTNPGKPSLVICVDGTFTLTWTERAELKGTDPTFRNALPITPTQEPK